MWCCLRGKTDSLAVEVAREMFLIRRADEELDDRRILRNLCVFVVSLALSAPASMKVIYPYTDNPDEYRLLSANRGVGVFSSHARCPIFVYEHGIDALDLHIL